MREPSYIVGHPRWTQQPYLVFKGERAADMITFKVDRQCQHTALDRASVAMAMETEFLQDSLDITFHDAHHRVVGIQQFQTICVFFRYDNDGRLIRLLEGTVTQMQEYLTLKEES